MRSIMVVFSDDMIAPLATLRRCLLRYCFDPKQNGVVVLGRGYAASDSDCVSRNMMVPSFPRCFKNQAVALLRMLSKGPVAGPTESAITKPSLREACFLVPERSVS